MARCHHDKQDLKSDLIIEVAKEGDILEAGQDLDQIKCYKNPGHRGFIPFQDLTLEHLPIERRDKDTFDNIKKRGDCVVRLVVDKMKNGSMTKEIGSGFVGNYMNAYLIFTNNHIVKTDDEVKHCTVEFHYDDDSRSDVLTSRGVRLVATCPYRDVTFFKFHPVPVFLLQLDLNDNRSPNIVIMYKDNKIVNTIIVKKQTLPLSFLSLLNTNSSLIDLMFIVHVCHDGSISYIKSWYFKFQPIPSNIQELTSIEIHIDEDGGNSRVIPGNVVTFGDEFVVKISESIFQDEVKKCRLVWNGEVIGRGTRLYFQQMESSRVFNGIDLEIYKKLVDILCVVEFHPMPRYVEAWLHSKPSIHACCIGHPHGGIKMVTFGRLLDNSPERFDNLYRRISQPNPDCQCKVVNCLKYSCKTCKGSSGSPVFPLHKGFDLSFGLSHFMGESVQPFISNGELVENINIAWIPISPS